MSIADDSRKIENDDTPLRVKLARLDDQVSREINSIFKARDNGNIGDADCLKKIYAAALRYKKERDGLMNETVAEGEIRLVDVDLEIPMSDDAKAGAWRISDGISPCDLHAAEINGFLLDLLKNGKYTAEEVCDTALEYFGPTKCAPWDRDQYDVKYRHRIRACLEIGVKKGKYKHSGLDRGNVYFI